MKFNSSWADRIPTYCRCENNGDLCDYCRMIEWEAINHESEAEESVAEVERERQAENCNRSDR